MKRKILVIFLALAVLSCCACAGGAAEEKSFTTRAHLVYNVLQATEHEISEDEIMGGRSAAEGEYIAEASVRADELTDTISFVFSIGEESYARLLQSEESVEVRYGVSSKQLEAGQIVAGGESAAVAPERGGRIVLAFEGANVQQNSGKIFQCVLCVSGKVASAAGHYRVEVGVPFTAEAEAALLEGGAQQRGASNGSSGGYVDFISAGGAATFSVYASAPTEAKFAVTVGLLNDTFFNALSDVYRIEVNGEEFPCSVSVQQGLGINWQIWTRIRVGNVSLQQGENTIRFTGIAPLLLDCITLQPLSGALVRAA